LSNANIANLTGINAFVNLSSLTVNNNTNITTFNPIAYLYKLKYLEFGGIINGNPFSITSLPTSLTVLKINYISNLFTFSPTLPYLRKLIVDGNNIGGVASYSGGSVIYPPSIDTIIFQNMGAQSFHNTYSPQLPIGLKYLSATNDYLQFFGAVPDSITYFNLPHGVVTGAIPNFPALATYINVSGDLVGNSYWGYVTSVPSTIPAGVTYFNILGNQITGNAPSPSSANNVLTHYDISHNSISYCNLSNLNNVINYVNISHNQISNNSLGNLPLSLTYLDVSYNSILWGFNVPKNLTTFGCSHNQLNYINGLDSTTLTTIDISYNQFYQYFPNLPNTVNTLNVSHNQLTGLGNYSSDLRTMCPNLNAFDGSYNQFSSFNLSWFPTSIYSISYRANNLFGAIDLTNQDVYNYPTVSQGVYWNLYYLDFGINHITDITQTPNFQNNYSPSTFMSNNVCPFYCYYAYNTLLCDSNSLTQNSTINLDIGSGNQYSASYLYFDVSKNNLGDSGISKLLSSNLFYKLGCQKTNISKLPQTATYCYALDCSNNINLTCFPPFVHGSNHSSLTELNFTNTSIQCFSNFSPLSSFTSTPSMFTYGMCFPNNVNSCPSFVNINGNLYNDINSNHLLDNADIRVQNVPVKLYKKRTMTLLQKTFSNYYGQYFFDISPSDTFVIKVDTAGTPLVFNTPTIHDTLQAKITPLDSMKFNKDFSMKCKSSYNDLVLKSIHSGMVRQGQNIYCSVEAIDAYNYYNIQNCNVGNLYANVTVILNGGIKYSNAASWSYPPNYVSATLDTIKWINKALSKNNWNLHFDFYCNAPTSLVIGSNVCLQATTTPVGFTDNNLSNNSFTYCTTVLGALDPNLKDNFPTNQLNTTDDNIVYTIHFQNTGTASAINVVVKDTLDHAIDPFSLELLSYSFQPKAIVDSAGHVSFNFINIMLPDTSVSKDSSQGFVQFRVKFKNTLPFAYSLHNQASIYFDYNTPIVTNAAFNIYCPHPIIANKLIQVCNAPYYVFKNDTFYHSVVINDTIKHHFSCDSIFATSIQFIVPYNDTVQQTICYGKSYFYNNHLYSSSGASIDTVHSIFGCDSLYSRLVITLLPLNTTNIFDTVCHLNTFYFNGRNLNTAGIYNDTLLSYFGCDSFIVLHLFVKPYSTVFLNSSTCINYPYYFNNHFLNQSGTYQDTAVSYNGCDSFIVLILTIKNNSSSVINRTTCNNQTYNFNGKICNKTGTFLDTIVNHLGCDSFITLHLTVLPISNYSYNQNVCANQFYTFNNQALNSAGTYFDTLINYVGCDSFITLHLSVLPVSNYSFNQSICANQSFGFNNHSLNIGGNYYDTLQNYLGCDSIIILHLTILPVSNYSFNKNICNGNSFMFNNHVLIVGGTYYDTLINYLGCDSFITLHLTILNTSTATLNQNICSGSSYLFNHQNVNTSGTYFDTIQNYLGCDSLITLYLNVLNSSSNSLVKRICSGQSYYFNGNNLTTAGTYFDTLTNYLGCDSLIILYLQTGTSSINYVTQTICSGQSYMFNNQTLTQSGIYYDTVTVQGGGCYTIVALNLTVLNNSSSSTNATICNGQVYIFCGHNLAASGIYTYHFSNYLGCDSSANLNLTVTIPNVTIQQVDSVLIAQASNSTFQWFDCSTHKSINGATNDSLIPHSTGYYGVIVTTQNCIDTSACYYVGISTGMNYLTNDNFVKIFPNPTNSLLSIEWTNESNIQKIILVDALGRKIKEFGTKGIRQIITMNELEDGIYFLHLIGKTKNVIKVIKE
jgi:uncharacterized repeat protein (TIGR01451 family)